MAPKVYIVSQAPAAAFDQLELQMLDKLDVLDNKLTILDMKVDTKLTILDTKVDTLRQDVSELRRDQVTTKEKVSGLDGLVEGAVTVNVVVPKLALFTFANALGLFERCVSRFFLTMHSIRSCI